MCVYKREKRENGMCVCVEVEKERTKQKGSLGLSLHAEMRQLV